MANYTFLCVCHYNTHHQPIPSHRPWHHLCSTCNSTQFPRPQDHAVALGMGIISRAKQGRFREQVRQKLREHARRGRWSKKMELSSLKSSLEPSALNTRNWVSKRAMPSWNTSLSHSTYSILITYEEVGSRRLLEENPAVCRTSKKSMTIGPARKALVQYASQLVTRLSFRRTSLKPWTVMDDLHYAARSLHASLPGAYSCCA